MKPKNFFYLKMPKFLQNSSFCHFLDFAWILRMVVLCLSWGLGVFIFFCIRGFACVFGFCHCEVLRFAKSWQSIFLNFPFVILKR